LGLLLLDRPFGASVENKYLDPVRALAPGLSPSSTLPTALGEAKSLKLLDLNATFGLEAIDFQPVSC
jgi:hypothetical protein